MDTGTLARFPFLSGAAAFAESLRADLESLLQGTAYEEARSRGRQRVLGALRSGDIQDVPLAGGDFDCLQEIMSYLYARLLVSAINDPFLTRRYALAEAIRLNRNLGRLLDARGEETVIDVARELGVNAISTERGLMMHFTDFLHFSSRIKSPEWKLINTEVFSGFVYLPGPSFCRVLQNALHDRLEKELPLDLPEEIVAGLKPIITSIVNELEARKSKYSTEGIGELRPEFLPPCMRTLLANVQNGVNLPHSGRFALTSFLHNLGMGSEEIMLLFAASPDFDESKTLYQIRHITGESSGTEYTPPECATMKTHGICYEPDALCENEKVNHPLVYYRIKSSPRQREGERKQKKGKE